MRIRDWSSDVCSSDHLGRPQGERARGTDGLSASCAHERARPRRALEPAIGEGEGRLTPDDDTPPCRLYLLTPGPLVTGGLDLDDFLGQLDAALHAGDVAALQLRLKDVPDHDVREAARAILPRVHDVRAAFHLNDRPAPGVEPGR